MNRQTNRDDERDFTDYSDQDIRRTEGRGEGRGQQPYDQEGYGGGHAGSRGGTGRGESVHRSDYGYGEGRGEYAGGRGDYGGRGPYGGREDYGWRGNYGQGSYGIQGGYGGQGTYGGPDVYSSYSGRGIIDHERGDWQGFRGGYRPYNERQQWSDHRNRSDEEIEDHLNDALDNDPQIPDTADINVEVNDKKVTLSGNVRNLRIKMAAGDCAFHIPGVRDVFNNINVTGRGRRRSEEQSASGMTTGGGIAGGANSSGMTGNVTGSTTTGTGGTGIPAAETRDAESRTASGVRKS